MLHAALFCALLIRVVSHELVYLHDGSPLFGEESTGPTGKTVTSFLGIPFAEPPLGSLRFRKPKPKTPWRHVYNATQLPNACYQSMDTYFGDFFGATMWNPNTKMSEDCLYLNVFVPGKVDPTKRLAVMVWVYGGGFWGGSSTLDVYNGKILPVEENVILVSMQYRVTIFGFLYLGVTEAPGNVGLWDQQLALKWVHKHIDVFGGDPSRITLFGESAGAASVNMHMLSQKSIPFFQRAILQSGSATAPWAVEPRHIAIERSCVVYNVMQCGNMSMQKIDVAEILRCLVEADPETLLKFEWEPVREFADFPWVPVVDGDFLTESPATSLRQGRFKDIFPVKDFFSHSNFVPDRQTWLKGIEMLLPRQMLKSALTRTAIVHEYEPYIPRATSREWINAMDKMLGDYLFTCNVNEMALAHAKHGGDTFYYYFTHRASAQTWPEWMGVLHGYEINFIFGEPFNTAKFSYTQEERELSSRFMRYWANFAKTGDPNKNEDGTYTQDVWPRYTQTTMEYMNLTVESQYSHGARKVGYGPRKKECLFWKFYVPNLMSALAEYGDPYLIWKQQMEKWQNEYITDWQLQFEQYKKYQTYRQADSADCHSDL